MEESKVKRTQGRRLTHSLGFFALFVQETTDLGIIIIANKSDLDSTREVSVEEGTKLARRLGVPIFEVSAKTRTNLVQAFNSIVKECSKRDEKEYPVADNTSGTSKKNKKSRSTSISASDLKKDNNNNNVEIVVSSKATTTTTKDIAVSAPASPKSGATAPSSGGLGGGCFGLFRRGRSRSESAPQKQQQQREIVVAHM